MKRNMIICRFELRLTNRTTLAIATLLSFEILWVSYLFLSDQEKSTGSVQRFDIC